MRRPKPFGFDLIKASQGGRFELRPPVESSDLDEKVLTTTPVRDIWMRLKVASVTKFASLN